MNKIITTTTYNKHTRGVLSYHQSLESNKIETEEIGHVAGSIARDMWIGNDLTVHSSTRIDVPNNITLSIGATFTVPNVPIGAWVEINGKNVQVSGTGLKFHSNSTENYVYRLVGEYYSETATISFVDLTDYKTKNKLKVDQAAELERAKAITSGSGQLYTYLSKAEAARAKIAGDTLTEMQQAWLSAEAGRMGISDTAAAQNIITALDACDAAMLRIDQVRLNAKSQIGGAATTGEIDEIILHLNWQG